MPLIEGPCGDLWFEAMGEGAPVSLWVHGLTGSTFDLRPLAAHTAGTRILMDLRGHGRSGAPPPEDGYDIASYAADIEAVADVVGATGAFGISSGAAGLIELAAAQPDRFERIALFLPAARSISADDRAGLIATASALESTPIDALADMWASADSPLYAARPYWREIIRDRTSKIDPVGVPRAIRAYVASLPFPEDDPEALALVRASVLLLAHEGDPVHTASRALELAGHLKDARVRIWPEPLAMYDDLDGFAGLIGDHLGSVSSGGAE